MTLASFTPAEMTQSIRLLGDLRQNFLSQRYFGRKEMHSTNMVMFGKMVSNAYIARYSRSGEAAKIVAGLAGTLNTIVAPIIKLAKVLDENKIETLNPALPMFAGPVNANPNAQTADKINLELADLRAIIDKSVEVQAGEALQSGTVTLTYEDSTTITISFGFTSGTGDAYTIQPALSGTAAWDKSAANIWGDLEDLAAQIRPKYQGPLDVIMGKTALAAFMNSEKVQKLLDNRRIEAGGLSPAEAAAFKGTFNGMNIFAYANSYHTAAGTDTAIWNPKTIVVLPEAGGEAFSTEYGAVFDYANPDDPQSIGFIKTDYHAQMLMKRDPAVLEMVVQSRPIVCIKDAGLIRVKRVIA